MGGGGDGGGGLMVWLLTLLHAQQPKLYGVLAVLSTIGLILLTDFKGFKD